MRPVRAQYPVTKGVEMEIEHSPDGEEIGIVFKGKYGNVTLPALSIEELATLSTNLLYHGLLYDLTSDEAKDVLTHMQLAGATYTLKNGLGG